MLLFSRSFPYEIIYTVSTLRVIYAHIQNRHHHQFCHESSLLMKQEDLKRAAFMAGVERMLFSGIIEGRTAENVSYVTDQR